MLPSAAWPLSAAAGPDTPAHLHLAPCPPRRCGSDGVSGAVDPTGAVLARADTGSQGVVQMALPNPGPARRDTVYALRGGWLFGWVCVAVAAGAAGAALAPESTLGPLRGALGAGDEGDGAGVAAGGPAAAGSLVGAAGEEGGARTPAPSTPDRGKAPALLQGSRGASGSARASTNGGGGYDDSEDASEEEDAPLLRRA